MQKYKTIEEFINSLDGDKRMQVEALRKIITRAEPQLDEHIKWNAPSYVLNGEDRITFNLLNKENVVKLVFHMGALRKEDKKAKPVTEDNTGMIEWSSDIRGVMSFPSLEYINEKAEEVNAFVIQWLAIS